MNRKEALSGEIIFHSSRMLCRRWLASDAEAIFALYSDRDVCRWIDDGRPITREETNTWLSVTRRNYETRGYGMFALVEPSQNNLIGCIGLVHPGGQQETEVKYALHKSHWRRGLALEAVQAVQRHAWSELRIPNLVATVATENVGSQRVLARAGFALVERRLDENGSAEFLYEWSAT